MLVNILDMGCGNGEYLDLMNSSKYANLYFYTGM